MDDPSYPLHPFDRFSKNHRPRHAHHPLGRAPALVFLQKHQTDFTDQTDRPVFGREAVRDRPSRQQEALTSVLLRFVRLLFSLLLLGYSAVNDRTPLFACVTDRELNLSNSPTHFPEEPVLF